MYRYRWVGITAIIIIQLNKFRNLHSELGPYLNMVCTATIVLQSAKVSSSAELDSSLLTTTTFSARDIPALSKSSRLQNIQTQLSYKTRYQCIYIFNNSFVWEMSSSLGSADNNSRTYFLIILVKLLIKA